MDERSYQELTAEDKNKLISSSLMLLRSVTEVWGAEKGMALWDTISSTISVDLKGDLFFGMISGKYSLHGVTFDKPDPVAISDHFVGMIKAVRIASGLGLKDAKDFCDKVRAGQIMTLEVAGKERQILLASLHSLGIEAR